MPAHTPSGSRLTSRELVGRKIEVLTVHRRNEPGVELDHVGTGDDVFGGGLRQRFAGVERFEMGELVVAFPQDLHGAQHDPSAFHRGNLRPDLEASLRSGNRCVDVALTGLLDFADHAVRGRVDRFERLTPRWHRRRRRR